MLDEIKTSHKTPRSNVQSGIHTAGSRNHWKKNGDRKAKCTQKEVAKVSVGHKVKRGAQIKPTIVTRNMTRTDHKRWAR